MTTKEERQLRKDAARWAFWRGQGIAVGDAPLDYRTGAELDRYTDEAIKAKEKHDKRNKP